MTEIDIKALIVGPEDSLFVVFKGENVKREMIKAMGDSIHKTRPELKGRVFIMAGDDIELAVVKGKENSNGKGKN